MISAIALRGEEGLDVKDALLDLLLCHRQAAVLHDRQDSWNAPSNRVGGPGGRPWRGLLGREGGERVALDTMPERPGDPNGACAPEALDDLLVVCGARPLGTVVDLGGPPLFEIGDGPPARVARSRQKRLERGAVLSKQIGDRPAQGEQVPRAKPGDERRHGLRARRSRGHRKDVGACRRPGIAVLVVEQRAREACPHPGLRHAVEPGDGLRRLGGISAGGHELPDGAQRPTSSPSVEAVAATRKSEVDAEADRDGADAHPERPAVAMHNKADKARGPGRGARPRLRCVVTVAAPRPRSRRSP